MNADRATRLAVAFALEAANAPSSQLCAVCAAFAGVTAAGITIMGGDHAGPVCVSSSTVRALEDLQFTVGQGPCRDAFRTGEPVHAARIDASIDRWPPFVELAKTCGIEAVYAYPLEADGQRIGVLTLYHEHEGELTKDQHDDSLALADIVTKTMLRMQALAPGGTLAPGLDEAVAYRAEVYQASGMIAIQLQIPAAEALLRMRAHAFTTDQTLSDVAADIVARRLRLSDDRRQPDDEG